MGNIWDILSHYHHIYDNYSYYYSKNKKIDYNIVDSMICLSYTEYNKLRLKLKVLTLLYKDYDHYKENARFVERKIWDILCGGIYERFYNF